MLRRSPPASTRGRRQRGLVLAGLLGALLLAAGCNGSGGAPADGTRAASATAAPPSGQGGQATPAASPTAVAALGKACGWRSQPSRWRHVVWIYLENRSFADVVGTGGSAAATAAPFINTRLVPQCGLATNFHSETHPSTGNYLASVAGSTGGVARDCSPKGCSQQGRPSIFGAVVRAGLEWRTFAAAMPGPCYPWDSGRYAVRHNPATYYRDAAAKCRAWDVSMGTESSGPLATALRSGLPAFTILVPDLCDDMHDCPARSGDAWLARWIPRLVSSPDYRAGNTAIFVTWDEGRPGGHHGLDCAAVPSDQSCHIPTLVISPSTRPGTRGAQRYDHYSMLRTTQEMLALRPLLGQAASPTTASMRREFGL